MLNSTKDSKFMREVYHTNFTSKLEYRYFFKNIVVMTFVVRVMLS